MPRLQTGHSQARPLTADPRSGKTRGAAAPSTIGDSPRSRLLSAAPTREAATSIPTDAARLTLDARLTPRAATVASRYRAVRQVVQAMHERFDESLHLDELARVAFLSPYHFSRVFRDATGVPPGRFLAALRMHEAKRLLLTTPYHVTDICFEVGYTSLGTFTTTFKHLVGLAPCRLRQLTDTFGSDPIESLCSQVEFPSRNGARGVAGWVEPVDGFEGVAFVGLFPRPLPQGRPVACTVTPVPGPFWLTDVPDGRHFALAVAFPSSQTVFDTLLPEGPLPVGAVLGGVSVRDGRSSQDIRIVLRRSQPTDPPIVLALPLLLAEQLAEGDDTAAVPVRAGC